MHAPPHQSQSLRRPGRPGCTQHRDETTWQVLPGLPAPSGWVTSLEPTRLYLGEEVKDFDSVQIS